MKKQFKDRISRVITLQFPDEGDLEALFEGKVIGTFEFRMDDENPYDLWELTHMDIREPFQNFGTRAEMMRFAVQNYEYFLLPLPINFGAPNYLTEEGAALVNHCFKNGILSANSSGTISRNIKSTYDKKCHWHFLSFK